MEEITIWDSLTEFWNDHLDDVSTRAEFTYEEEVTLG